MASEALSARELTARLLAHVRSDGRSSATAQVEAAATAFHRVSAELSRWMGASGCRALLMRALRQAEADHPALMGVGVAGESPPRLGPIDESVETHGARAIAAGLEAALVALFELLSRLIGDDLSTKLAELSMTNGVPDAAEPADERAPQP